MRNLLSFPRYVSRLLTTLISLAEKEAEKDDQAAAKKTKTKKNAKVFRK